MSGIVVIDVDHRPGIDGDESVLELQHQLGLLPDTVEVKTGGGGRHMYFKWPGHSVRSRNPIAEGLDCKADGGSAIAPPSIHESGQRYEWEGDSHPDDVEVADLPQRWVRFLTGELESERKKATSLPDVIRKGGRNETLTSLAGTMRRRGAGKEAILAALLEENSARCDPPLEEAEVSRIAASVARYAPEHRVTRSPGRNGASPEPAEWPNYADRLTDMANGQRFAQRHGQDVRQCIYLPQEWLVWDGHHFRPDDTGQVERWAKLTALSIYSEASEVVGDDSEAAKLRDDIVKWARSSQHSSRLTAMLTMARSEPKVRVRPEDLDCDAWLFNAANATIDLHTGEALGQRRGDLITKISTVVYDPNASAPRWLAFLDRIFDGNEALISFVQRAVGYSLTGDTSEQVIIILYGTGANGKTTLLLILSRLMGDYGQWSEFSTFLMKDRDAIRNDLAALKGARLVSAAESTQGRRLDETVIKQVTGGDVIRARFLRREFFEYQPAFKLWLATNHKPEIRGTDLAIWRRIRLIPFEVTIPDEEQDRHLSEKLMTELPGVLNWALEGLAAWRDHGLGYPDEVRSATEEYRAEQDYLLEFLSDVTSDERQGHALRNNLYLSYQQWCKKNGEKTLGSKRFSQMMVDRGYERGQFGSDRVRGFGGLTLRAGWPEPE